jgi:hypothetical protein
MTSADNSVRWLLLVHQLPAKPAYLRVKIWRRLQALGAISLKGAVAALPATDQTREDLQWVMREVTDGGGEAILCDARFVDGLTDLEAEALFSTARSTDYEVLASDLRAIDKTLPDEPLNHWNGRAEVQGQIVRFRKRLTQIATIDFFDAGGRRTVEGLIDALETRLSGPPAETKASAAIDASSLTGSIWVTRARVGIDRIACAWLIRRFIDPQARFKFVSDKNYARQTGEVRFDMLEAEFTHEGDRCSFETILRRLDLTDPALHALGEIIHDIDLKDAKFGRQEVPGIARLIEGIALASLDDEHRIARGSAALDDLYLVFSKQLS